MGATTKILENLRKLMKDTKYCPTNLSAYIITSSDAHDSEYTADWDKRREYVSKFTGSAGTCVITQDKALLWTDGRYFIQAANQLDENWTLMKNGNPGVPTIDEWLVGNLPNDSIIGTDPLLISYGRWKQLSEALTKGMKNLVAINTNLVDIIWKEDGKKDMPYSNIYIYPIEYAGMTWQDKIDKIQQKLNDEKVDYLFISALDSISWLFNLRGNDIQNCPVFRAYTILSNTTIDLFIHTDGLTNQVTQHLLNSNDPTKKVNIQNYHTINQYISSLSSRKIKIWINNGSPAAFSLDFDNDKLLIQSCPVYIMKSIKNEVEQKGIRNACIRDSAALCEYFGYLQDEINKCVLTEITGAKYLHDIRKKMDKFMDLSFPAISSSGANSAIIHYQPENSPKPVVIDPNSIYLCDSGAQYWDGTTDITRTLHYNTPTDQEILAFTMVLKGHINLAKSVFPEKTKGHSLDVLARLPLWSIGLDYLHGTGHGIGCFLCVHEGPQNISHRSINDYDLMDGVLLSNEPGYYEDGKFGIRIENMMFVKEKKDIPNNFNGIKFLTFETVSLVPIQRELIDISLLTKDEIDWLNQYHQECYDKVGPILEQNNMLQGLKWLKRYTQPIPNN